MLVWSGVGSYDLPGFTCVAVSVCWGQIWLAEFVPGFPERFYSEGRFSVGLCASGLPVVVIGLRMMHAIFIILICTYRSYLMPNQKELGMATDQKSMQSSFQ